jgi:hypothetical protein
MTTFLYIIGGIFAGLALAYLIVLLGILWLCATKEGV